MSFAAAVRVLLVVAALVGAGPVFAAESRLGEFLAKLEPGSLIAGADRFGPPEGTPPTAPIYQGDTPRGFAYLNADVVDATGYSGKPIQIVVAIDTDGKIAGAQLVEHHEPIVLVGIPEAKIRAVIDHFRGADLGAIAAGSAQVPQPDIISGATVTVLVIGDSIMRSALKIMQQRSGVAAATPAQTMAIDTAQSEVLDWLTLTGDGSVRRLHLTVGDVNDAFARSGNAKAAKRREKGQPDQTFVDLYVAPATIPTVGRSLLGDAGYEQMVAGLAPGQQAILVMGEGRYSFKGSGYVRGGIFDRIELVQGLESVRFKDKSHTRIGSLAADGAPRFKEIALFAIPPDTAFDPAQPWQLKLLVQRATGALEKAFLTFDVGYIPPAKYLKPVAAPAPAGTPEAAATAGEPEIAAGAALPEAEPLWQRIWRDRAVDVAVLLAALLALTWIFFFQDWLVRRPRLFIGVRFAFLAFTLFWLGWYIHAQASVVNVLTWINALMTDFRWEYFLMDPPLFLLWCSIAAGLLFWGRGPFCGWLCPFGALQEFTNRIARRLRVPQVTVPWGLHERLWPIKYIIFLGLFGASLYSLGLGERLAEVEPFKTVIILGFDREWPFIAFAGALLVAGLFIERFFCRYLCPLGAALAIPGRLRMFDWLKRYRECGSPCQRCANECPVQAIRPEGQINVNECIYCMHCQLLYWDDHKCPVMVQKRLKREKREAMSTPGPRAPAAPVVARTATAAAAPSA